MTPADHRFPLYSRAEHRLDSAVHLIGVPVGVMAAAWLMALACASANPLLIATMAVYAAGLVGMLGTSAAYHLTPPGRAKELLRRADHAVIFVMIAGTYTPLALNVLAPPGGVGLCAVIWALACVGITLKLAFPRRFERLSLALYLGMGWAVLAMIGQLVDRLPGLSLVLLVGGGVVYSLGAVIYTRHRLKYHTACWHALVLTAVCLHATAMHAAFAPP